VGGKNAAFFLSLFGGTAQWNVPELLIDAASILRHCILLRWLFDSVGSNFFWFCDA
jgi:hypothetical protein